MVLPWKYSTKAKSLRQFVADNQSKKAYRISMNHYQLYDAGGMHRKIQQAREEKRES